MCGNGATCHTHGILSCGKRNGGQEGSIAKLCGKHQGENTGNLGPLYDESQEQTKMSFGHDHTSIGHDHTSKVGRKQQQNNINSI